MNKMEKQIARAIQQWFASRVGEFLPSKLIVGITGGTEYAPPYRKERVFTCKVYADYGPEGGSDNEAADCTALFRDQKLQHVVYEFDGNMDVLVSAAVYTEDNVREGTFRFTPEK